MRQISDALSYVENHYAEAMKVKDLSVACGMSETYFRRVFEMKDVTMQPVIWKARCTRRWT